MPKAFYPITDIQEFHEKFGLDYRGPPKCLPYQGRPIEGEDPPIGNFRARFMNEELDEWVLSNYKGDLEGCLDAIVDLIYVALGTAYLQGIDHLIPEAWARVHAANMSKVRATSVEQSKRGSTADVVKPEGWKAPEFGDLFE